MVIKSANLSDAICEKILNNIITLEYPPGSPISEISISEQFNVSRTPVKKAFSKLEARGLIFVKPQVGTFVSKINADNLFHSLFIRAELEKAIISRAMSNYNEEWSYKLQINLQEQNELLNLEENIENSIKFWRLDDKFHKLIFQMAESEFIWNHIKKDAHHMDRYRLLSCSIKDFPNLKLRINDHFEIYNLITTKDKKIYQKYDDHILDNIKETIINIKIKNESYFE